MHYYEVAPNQIIRANSAVFTYSSNTPLQIGQIVKIEVGKKTLIGVVIRTVEPPSFTTKPITQAIAQAPLPQPLINTALWMADYYATHLATILQTMLPRGVDKQRRKRPSTSYNPVRDRTHIVLNNAQRAAVQSIAAAAGGTILLHGVTGSGKTAVYIEAIKQALAKDKSAVVLVPEIALTSQLVDELSLHFSNIVLAHSRQTEAERHANWQIALEANQPLVVIGPRSALFLPVKHLGIIVVDEAHEASFKQEQAPRYSALRAAAVLASEHQAPVILGSATPNITDYYLAHHTQRPILTLESPARSDAVAPTITTIDMTKRTHFNRHRFLSDPLIGTITSTLATHKQVLIFHNRRGSASTTLCESCGWTSHCTRCLIPLTLHTDRFQLTCHLCAAHNPVPTSCPNCQHAAIIHKGIGTKLIETELKKLFPNKKIVRFDADTSAAESIEKRYAELYDGSIDIIIGTQVLAKGLDLPHLRTVGIVQADAGLALPDYTTTERTFQLLAQVVGRVGRSQHPTSVIVQSYQPSHPAIVDGLTQNYTHFYQNAITERRASLFPPFTHLLKLTCGYKTEAAAIKNAQQLARTLRSQFAQNIQVLGPTPAFYEFQAGTYRWQLTVKAPKRADLIAIVNQLPSSYWQYELDPMSLL